MTYKEALETVWEKIVSSTWLNCTVYRPVDVGFGSYDSWKLASRDDYYEDEEVTEEVPDEEEDYFMELAEERLLDEIPADHNIDSDCGTWKEFWEQYKSVCLAIKDEWKEEAEERLQERLENE